MLRDALKTWSTYRSWKDRDARRGALPKLKRRLRVGSNLDANGRRLAFGIRLSPGCENGVHWALNSSSSRSVPVTRPATRRVPASVTIVNTTVALGRCLRYRLAGPDTRLQPAGSRGVSTTGKTHQRPPPFRPLPPRQRRPGPAPPVPAGERSGSRPERASDPNAPPCTEAYGQTCPGPVVWPGKLWGSRSARPLLCRPRERSRCSAPAPRAPKGAPTGGDIVPSGPPAERRLCQS